MVSHLDIALLFGYCMTGLVVKPAKLLNNNWLDICKLAMITFCVSRRRRKMYCGNARLCVCLSVAVRPHYCTDPDVTWRHGRGCPLVVHYWAGLQSGHGLRCYGNITLTLDISLHPSCDMTTVLTAVWAGSARAASH